MTSKIAFYLILGITTLKYTIITLALVSYLRSSVARALHRHHKGVGSIPAGGPVVDEFFSTAPGWFFDMCMIQLELKTHLPFRIYLILVPCLLIFPIASGCLTYSTKHKRSFSIHLRTWLKQRENSVILSMFIGIVYRLISNLIYIKH